MISEVLAAAALLTAVLFLGHQWRLRARPYPVRARSLIADLWFGVATVVLFGCSVGFAWHSAGDQAARWVWAILAAEAAGMGVAVILLWRRVRGTRGG